MSEDLVLGQLTYGRCPASGGKAPGGWKSGPPGHKCPLCGTRTSPTEARTIRVHNGTYPMGAIYTPKSTRKRRDGA